LGSDGHEGVDVAGQSLEGDVADGDTESRKEHVRDTEEILIGVELAGETRCRYDRDPDEAEGKTNRPADADSFLEHHIGECRGQQRLGVGYHCRSTRPDEFSGVEHTQESEARRADAGDNQKQPRARAGRARTTQRNSPPDQGGPGDEGPQRGEGQMGRKSETYGDQRETRRPQEHDRDGLELVHVRGPLRPRAGEIITGGRPGAGAV